MGDSFKTGRSDPKKFATPDGAIETVASPIPGYREHWRLEFVLCHACQRMGPVMLDPLYRTPQLAGVFRRKIIRMQVAGDLSGDTSKILGQIGGDVAECRPRLAGLQVTDMLADKDIVADT